jgi:hypothetical protein
MAGQTITMMVVSPEPELAQSVTAPNTRVDFLLSNLEFMPQPPEAFGRDLLVITNICRGHDPTAGFLSECGNEVRSSIFRGVFRNYNFDTSASAREDGAILSGRIIEFGNGRTSPKHGNGAATCRD